MPASTTPPAENNLIDAALDALSAASPMALLDENLTAAAASRLARAAVTQPPKVVKAGLGLAASLAKVAVGRSDVRPEADKRFADEAWQHNPVYRRVGQAYLSWSRSVYDLIDDLGLDPKSELRSRFVAGLVTETVAPTNSLVGNPAALREAVRTRGRSLRDGARHALHDLRHNGAMPSMVDTRPFEVGRTVAATPGSVVLRNDVLELIRYAPSTAEVAERPLLMVPPQINKYYVLDLAPGRSFAEAAAQAGQQVFMISWRNPGPDQRDWDLDTYCAAILEAMAVTLDLTGQPDLNLVGVCAGGITSAALLGYLAATGDRRVNAVTFLVTVVDWDVPSTVGTFTSGPAVAASIQRSQSKGVLPGTDLARLFAWLRPNDLVWNYWVNNYLMGKNPPAFDILAWNADATNLPAGLHADFLQVASTNALTKPGGVEVLGEKVDLASVTCDAYVVGGLTDHITPWEGCYRTVNLLGGPAEFVACASGHIQTLVCPPGNAKARYLTNPARPAAAEEWKAGATTHEGSWWGHWLAWLAPRSGEQIPAPTELGSEAHPVVDEAPGRYVKG